MATITVRAKVQERRYADGTLSKRYVQLPALARKHCDMPAFRAHPRFGSYANSDLFGGMLTRIKREVAGESGAIDLANIPSNVRVDESGFLAVITIEV